MGDDIDSDTIQNDDLYPTSFDDLRRILWSQLSCHNDEAERCVVFLTTSFLSSLFQNWYNFTITIIVLEVILAYIADRVTLIYLIVIVNSSHHHFIVSS